MRTGEDGDGALGPPFGPARMGRSGQQQLMNAVKRSAIRTGQLKTFLSVHLRPIDVVVFHGPSVRPEADIETWS